MDIMDKSLTVFTPTYNRAYILPQCYYALCQQTSKDFVWMIVDDGSTDETKQLIENWINENIINIQYIYQDNKGKQRAFNTALLNCQTRYLADLDSDDYYKKDTIEKFLYYLSKIKDNEKVAGVVARRGTPDGKIIGNPYLPKKIFVSNIDTIIRKYNFYGDTSRAYKTEILKQHMFPEIEDKFIPEDVMWSSIDRKYNVLIVNEVFTICEYLEDGYTKNILKIYKQNPIGYSLGLNQLSLAKRGLIQNTKNIIIYTTWCWHFNIKNPLKNCKNKIRYILALPLSLCCYILKVPKWIYEN